MSGYVKIVFVVTVIASIIMIVIFVVTQAALFHVAFTIFLWLNVLIVDAGR